MPGIRLARLKYPALGLAVFCLVTAWLPYHWCAREGGRWYDGDSALQARLAAGVTEWISPGANGLDRASFSTGSSQFDGEWLFGTYLMSGLGLGQTALEHPEWRERNVKLMDHCIERILSPQVRAFDAESWSDVDPIAALDGEEYGHIGYLGYFNMLLSLRRSFGDMPQAKLNDRITEYLVRGVEKAPVALLRTYPIETYPVDNTSVGASIALYDRATGASHAAVLERWTREFRARCIDPRTGLLYQCVIYRNGEPIDAPRGSGTALGAYFLGFADKALSRELYDAAKRELSDRVLGFGMLREYPKGVPAGWGDIDSGPVVFGYAISPTGFSIGLARMHGDRDQYTRLYASAYAFGAPSDRGGRRHFVSGGPLGDAILFAMLTAQPTLPGKGASQ
ncbi:MAG: hypothetical protein RBU21_04190 [FCB group bacterium]|jgi:hypothetical protein|nr:hypothetical protein [FCB group bacterium]